MNTQVISVEPIAIFIHKDHVILWMDTPEGWTILNGFSFLPKEARITTAKSLVAALPSFKNGNQRPDGSMARNMLVLELGKTSLPPHLPKDSIIGLAPEFASDPDVPHLNRDGRV